MKPKAAPEAAAAAARSPPWFVTLTSVSKGAVPLSTAPVGGLPRTRLSLAECVPALCGSPELLRIYVAALADGDVCHARATAELAKADQHPHSKNARLAQAVLAAGTANVQFCVRKDTDAAFAALVSVYCATRIAGEQLLAALRDASSDAVRAVALCALQQHRAAVGGPDEDKCGLALGGAVVDIALHQPQRAAGRPGGLVLPEELEDMPLGVTVFRAPQMEYAAGAVLAHQLVSTVRMLQRGTWHAQGRTVLLHVDRRYRDAATLLGIADGMELGGRGKKFLERVRVTLDRQLSAANLHFALRDNCLMPCDAEWHRGDSFLVLAVWGEAGAEAGARELVRRALQAAVAPAAAKVEFKFAVDALPAPAESAAAASAAAEGLATAPSASAADPAFLALHKQVRKLSKMVKEGQRLQAKDERLQSHQEKEKVRRLPALQAQLAECSADLTALGVFLDSQA